MKKTEFKRADGTAGENISLDKAGDVFTSRFSLVRAQHNIATVDGEQKVISNYSLGVNHDGKDIFIRLTAGQVKAIALAGDLKNKTLETVAYENEFGDQIGLRIKK